jgi:branched-chain amino acid transport system substrate-binding protein
MTPGWRRYSTALHQAFPELNDGAYTNQPYYDGVEPVLEALEQVNGDLSDGQRRFAAALAHLRYHGPQGLITLDRRHQAIAPIYLGRVVVTNGKPRVKQIGVVKHVHQTLGGYFSPTSPAPSQTQPACRSAAGRTSSGSGSTT